MAIRNLPDVWRRDWSPIREVARLQRSIDRMFNDFLSPMETNLPTDIVFNPACDIEETEGKYLITFDLPGVKKDDLKIELNENQLTISGERKEERHEKGSRHNVERYHGAFQRSFTLPSIVDPNQVMANFENGVLQISIPKGEASKAKLIPVKEGRLIAEKEKEKEKKEKAA